MSLACVRDGVFADQRRPSDCMCVAVGTYIGLPYELTPDVSGRRDATTSRSGWAEWVAQPASSW
jgi:hypothetical protein